MADNGRYTALIPNIAGFSPVAPILLLSNLLITEWVVVWMALGILGFEIIAKLSGMTMSMLARALKRGVVSLIWNKGVHSTPLAWKRSHWLSVCFCVGLGVFTPIEESNATLTITDSMSYDRKWQTGMIGQRKEDVVEAMCNACPIKIGLDTIIPDDFSVFVGADVKGKSISYTGSRPWGQILQELAENNDLDVEVMRHRNRVIVSKAPSRRGRVVVTSLDATSKGFFDTKTWELIPGDTLEKTLNRWASVEGWHVIYKLENDITIEVPAVFSGNLIEAVNQVLKSYKEIGIFTRVNMDYSHVNNTIKISLGSAGKKQ